MSVHFQYSVLLTSLQAKQATEQTTQAMDETNALDEVAQDAAPYPEDREGQDAVLYFENEGAQGAVLYLENGERQDAVLYPEEAQMAALYPEFQFTTEV